MGKIKCFILIFLLGLGLGVIFYFPVEIEINLSVIISVFAFIISLISLCYKAAEYELGMKAFRRSLRPALRVEVCNEKELLSDKEVLFTHINYINVTSNYFYGLELRVYLIDGDDKIFVPGVFPKIINLGPHELRNRYFETKSFLLDKAKVDKRVVERLEDYILRVNVKYESMGEKTNFNYEYYWDGNTGWNILID